MLEVIKGGLIAIGVVAVVGGVIGGLIAWALSGLKPGDVP